MKKTFLFVISLFFANYLLMAQPACLKDITYSLLSLKEVPKARKMMEEECFPGNESSADVWLVRGNVFIQLHEYELERRGKDKKYVIRWPDAIITANASFYKAIELKPDIKPADPRLIDAKEGQVLSAYPISVIAANAMDDKDYAEAIRLYNIVIRSYRVDPKNYAEFLSYAYIDLANCYKAMGDNDNYKKTLIDAAKMNVAFPDIYLNLYDLYKQENDTAKCGEILSQARKVVPDENALNVKGYELDYFGMIGDTVKLKDAAVKMFEQYKDSTKVISILSIHLVNNKEYEIAQEMIETGLAIAPEDFELNQQMTYRFYYEAIDYDKIKEAKLNEKPRKFAEAETALNKANEILGIAVTWAEKTYNIKGDDRLHNIMYRQILVRLQMPVPEDLQQKVDSYYKQQ